MKRIPCDSTPSPYPRTYGDSVEQYDSKTALVVVDMQNDFADPSGSLYVSGGVDLVPVVNAEVIRAVSSGAFVVYTQDWHPESTPHFEKDGGIWPVHCVMDSWGAAFHPDLVVAGPTVRKGSNGEDGYSGFTMRDPITGEEAPTELDEMLHARSVEHVTVVGLALDYCVQATALDAVRLGYHTRLPPLLTRAVDLEPGDGARALDRVMAAGVGTG